MEKAERARDSWFNQARPMIMTKKTWMEKRLAREEGNNNEGSCYGSDCGSQGKMEVNMVFELPTEFRAPDEGVAELAFSAKAVVFHMPERLGTHVRSVFVTGYLRGVPIQQVMVDGGAGVNVMPWATFKKMGFSEGELMKTNTSLSAFTSEITEAKIVMSVELTIGSKTMATTFFVVDVGGRYNLLLGWDWIHMNGCIPLTLHYCLVQWVGEEVEVIPSEGVVRIAAAEAGDAVKNGETACLSRHDLSEYDYVSVSMDGLVPVSVKPTNVSRLSSVVLQ
jgi:hypothetical protein